LRQDLALYASPPYDFVVLHRRQGFYDDFCRQLEREREPIHQVAYKGVRLAGVYDLRDLPDSARKLKPW
jgi:hypothetical protein